MDSVVTSECVTGGKPEIVEVLVHLENGVDRAFYRSRDVPCDIHDATQVLVINAALDRLVFDDDQLA